MTTTTKRVRTDAVRARAVLRGRLVEVMDFGVRYLGDLRGRVDASEHLDKVVAEAALLMLIADRAVRRPAPDDRVPSVLRRALADLRRAVALSARSDRVLIMTRRRAADAVAVGLAPLALRAVGDRDDDFDDEVVAAFRSPTVDAVERLPFRQMDARWVRSLATGEPSQVEDLLPYSALTHGLDLVSCTRSDMYALTHAAMYATDFGQLPLPAELAESLPVAADVAAAHALLTDDLDVLTEVLFLPLLAGLGWTPLTKLGWQVIFEVWERFGFLPGPALRATDASSPDRVRDACYHTYFVGGLLCALGLTWPDRLPERGLPGRPPRHDGSSAHGPYVQTRAERLQPSHPHAYRQLALVAAMRQLDLVRAAHMLSDLNGPVVTGVERLVMNEIARQLALGPVLVHSRQTLAG